MIKISVLVLILSFVAGCSTTVTNLTPRQQVRNQNGLYPFEVALDSTQKTMRKDTIQSYVIVGSETYPMQPTPMVPNRWETLVPISPAEDFVNYRYKFIYQYDSIPQRRSSSILSNPYQLQIIE